MSEENSLLKIQLIAGNTLAEIRRFVAENEADKVLFSVHPSFNLITQLHFLKALQEIFGTSDSEFLFLTNKKYFQTLLRARGFRVFDKNPDDFIDQPLEKLSTYLGKVEAVKNYVPVANEVETVEDTPVELPVFKMQAIDNPRNDSSLRSWYFFAFLLILFFLGAVLLFISPKATVLIRPEVNVVPVMQNFVITLPNAEVNDEEASLTQVPAILVGNNVDGTETFSTLDKKYDLTNASGEVTLFNETEEAKFLVPSRLMNTEGMIFRFKKEVTIPPKEGELPGSAVVMVYADGFDAKGKPVGNRGNIDAGTELYFPGLRKDLRSLYYAKANRGPLVGGSTLVRYFFGETDVEVSKPFFVESLRFRAVEGLRTELFDRSERENTQYILIEHPKLLTHNVADFKPPETPIGEEVKTFDMYAQLELNGIVFDRAVLVEHLKAKLLENQDHRKKLLRVDPNSFEYRLIDLDKFQEEQWIKITAGLEGVEVIDFDQDNEMAKEWVEALRAEVVGKSVEEVRSVLNNYPEIKDVLDIKVSPFWAQNLPHVSSQIKFEIQID